VSSTIDRFGPPGEFVTSTLIRYRSAAIQIKRVRAETIDVLSQVRAQPCRRSILG